MQNRFMLLAILATLLLPASVVAQDDGAASDGDSPATVAGDTLEEAPDVGGELSEVPIETEAQPPEPTPRYTDPRDRRSRFDDPHARPRTMPRRGGPNAAPPGPPPGPPPVVMAPRPGPPPRPVAPSVARVDRDVDIPVTFAAHVGFRYEDPTVNVWLGYRARMVRDFVSPFVALGGEIAIVDLPQRAGEPDYLGTADSTLLMGPAIRAGINWVPPGWSGIPLASMYAIGAVGVDVTGQSDYQIQTGAGISLIPLSLELTRDWHVRDDEQFAMWQIRAGLMF